MSSFNFKTPRAFFMQCKDMAENDNRTPEMMVRDAQAMRAWAASRAGQPSFATMVAEANRQAACTMQQFRPRSA